MKRFLYMLLIAVIVSYGAHAQVIITCAGNGTSGYSGDGGPATAAEFKTSYDGMIADTAGNIYFADGGNYRVRKVSASGIITTVAGPGTSGVYGDGGPATAAWVNPTDVAIGRNGELYIADYGGSHGRIRKVDASGIITTVAGPGSAGVLGDGGPATAATISQYSGITLDSIGNLYIADNTNHRIRKVDTSGIITTIAGGNTYGFSGDGGPATAALLNYPIFVKIDKTGNIFIVDNYRVRKIDTSGIITTYAGGGSGTASGVPATNVALGPEDIALDTAGNIYISDQGDYMVRKVTPAGLIYTIAGNGTDTYSGDCGPPTAAGINRPYGMATDRYGNVYFTATGVTIGVSVRMREIIAHPSIPYFIHGSSVAVTVCENGLDDSLNAALTVIDSDLVLPDTWNVISGPSHGAFGGGGNTFNPDGDTLVPTGLSYTPTTGFHGNDTLRVAVANCYGADTITVYVTVTQQQITITGPPLLCVGGTLTLGDTVTGGVWSSSAVAVGSIGSGSGVVTGISGGTTVISYVASLSCGLAAAAKTLTVDSAPPAIAGNTPVCMGAAISLSSVSGGAWQSGAAGIATVGSASGIVTGVDTGVAVITYVLPGGCTTSVPVTVNRSPSAIAGPGGVCIGATVSLSDSVSGGVWSSGSGGVAMTGSGTGSTTGMSAGTSIITYTIPDGCTATKTITVNNNPAAIGGALYTCAGSSVTLTETSTGGAWSSGATGIATAGTGGLVTGISGGVATIIYTLPTGCSTSVPVTINPLPSVIAGSPVVCLGLTDSLKDTITGGNWASSDITIAYIDAATGVVTGLAAGIATITYTLGTGCYAVMPVTVTTGPTSITGTGSVCAGSSANLHDGVGGGTWSSGSPGIAIINPATGYYTGVLAGSAMITYSLGAGCATTTTVTVNPVPGTITGTLHVCAGSSTTLGMTTSGGAWSATPGSIAMVGTGGVVTGVSAGTAVVSYSIGGLCPATATVTVDPLPAISGVTHTCPGMTTTLASSIGGTWTSGTPTVATAGSTSGIISGLTSGSTVITNTSPAGCAASAPVTVNPAPAAIGGPSAVCTGATINLTEATPGGAWGRSNANVTLGTTGGAVTGIAPGASVITYTLPTGCIATKTVTVNASPGPVTGTLNVCVNSSATLGITIGGGAWVSSSPAIATIGPVSGIVTGVGGGTAPVTYTSPAGCTASATVTVSPLPSLFSVTGGGSYCAGGTTGLHIGLSGSAAGVTYQLYNSGSPAGTPLSGTGALDFGPQTAAGIYTVIATTAAGCARTMTGSATIAINPLPSPISGPTAVCVGATTTETDPGGGAWASGSPGIATIGPATGLVTGIAYGSTVITYTLPTTCSVTTTVTVSATPVTIGGASSVCAGATTTLTDAVSGGLWTSGTGGIATIGSISGTVSGISAGTASITYSLGSTGCSVYKAITVNASPNAIAGSLGLCVGHTTSLSTTPTGGNWTSGPTSIATAGTTGIVSGIAAGTAGITYTLPATGCMATATVTVNGLPPAIGGTTQVCRGNTTTLTDGAGGGTWASSNPAVASVGTGGIVSGAGTGTATITYSLGTGCAVTTPVTVNAIPSAIGGTPQVCAGSAVTLTEATPGGTWSSGAITTATVSGGTVSGIAAGTAPVSYTVAGCPATIIVTVNPSPGPIGGATPLCSGFSIILTAPPGGTWSSSNPATAAISPTGQVTGGTPGTATISYSLPTGCAATAVVTVNTAPAAIAGSPAVCIGSTTTLTDPTGGGIWSSSAPATATIGSSTGTVGAVALGTTTISYIAGGCPAVMTLTVTPLPGAIGGTPQVCAGAATTLTDGTPGGTWSSSNPLVAGIGTGTGTVTGIAAGTATVSYSLGAGCTVTQPVVVSPAPSPITGSPYICLGATAILNDGTPGGTWSSSNPPTAPVSGTGPGTGTVTGMSGGTAVISYTVPSIGCPAMLNVRVVQVPAISNVHNVCAWGDTIMVGDSDTSGLYSSVLATVTNIGGGHGIVTGVSPGTATLIYTLLPSGCMYTATLTVNPLPAPITGNDRVCTGSSATLGMTTPGGSWTSLSPAVATVSGGIVTGNTAGTANIIYTLPTGCTADTLVTVFNPPAAILGATQVCSGSSITLTDGSPGGTWSSSTTIAAVSGTATATVTGIGAGTATISYSLAASCLSTATVTVNALPLVYNVTGGGSYCAGGTGLHVGLSNTQTGTGYQLYNGTTPVSSLYGTGSSIDYGLQTTAGAYTVTGTDTATGCAAPMTGSVAIIITPTVTPTVSVNVTPGTTLCTAATPTFTAGSTNGGASPLYQWAINGVGTTTGSSYSYLPLNGDVISVTMTSDAPCAVPPVVSASVTMTVGEPVMPVVTITAHPGTTITAGQPDTLTATVTGGGASPAWQWYVNNIAQPGANTNTYISSSLTTNDTVSCQVTNTGPCGETGSQWVAITVNTNNGKTAVQTVTGEETLTVQPNPNKGVFTIKGTLEAGVDEQITIEVTDMLGQQVYSREATAKGGKVDEQVTLPTTTANAMYLLNVHTASGIKVFHIVVEE